MGTLYASSGSEEGILKLIERFYCGTKCTLKKISEKEYEIYNSKGLINGTRVVVKRKRFRLEAREL
jgi:hypothetical protein